MRFFRDCRSYYSRQRGDGRGEICNVSERELKFEAPPRNLEAFGVPRLKAVPGLGETKFRSSALKPFVEAPGKYYTKRCQD